MHTPLNDFKKSYKKFKLFPFFYFWEKAPEIEKLFLITQKGKKYYYFLDGIAKKDLDSWCFLSLSEPHLIFKTFGKQIIVKEKNKEKKYFSKDPLNELRKVILNKGHFPLNIVNMPPFLGGAAGYFSYDFGRNFEDIPKIAENDMNIPECYFLFCGTFCAYNLNKQSAYIVSLIKAEDDLNPQEVYNQTVSRSVSIISELYKLTSSLDFNSIMGDNGSNPEIESNFSELTFEKAVCKAKEYIKQGDIYQVNLAQRFITEYTGDPSILYLMLRKLNPSPYNCYLRFPEFNIVSCSPELLLRKTGNIVETRPIAGTRKRGETVAEDSRLSNDLILDPKERAEHIMLVDLERNDLSKVCDAKTVKVNEVMVLEKYSHVIHIVSNVRGKLSYGKDVFDLIKAVFPGGTITGCPKIRAMEIIEEIEPVRRGPYCGCAGWIGYNQDTELNILIRTILLLPANEEKREFKAFFCAGAGIVADSNPSREYFETIYKAKALGIVLGEKDFELSLKEKGWFSW